MTAATEEWTEGNVAEPPSVEVKLFGRWSPDALQVSDLSLAVSGGAMKGVKDACSLCAV